MVSVRAWVDWVAVITDHHHAPSTHNAFITGHTRGVTERFDASRRSYIAALADAEFFLQV